MRRSGRTFTLDVARDPSEGTPRSLEERVSSLAGLSTSAVTTVQEDRGDAPMLSQRNGPSGSRGRPSDCNALLGQYHRRRSGRRVVPKHERELATAWRVLVDQLPSLAAAMASASPARPHALRKVALSLHVASKHGADPLLASRFEQTNLLKHVMLACQQPKVSSPPHDHTSCCRSQVVAICLNPEVDSETHKTAVSILADAALFGCIDLLVGAGAAALYGRLLLAGHPGSASGAEGEVIGDAALLPEVVRGLSNFTASLEGAASFSSIDRGLLIRCLNENRIGVKAGSGNGANGRVAAEGELNLYACIAVRNLRLASNAEATPSGSAAGPVAQRAERSPDRREAWTRVESCHLLGPGRGAPWLALAGSRASCPKKRSIGSNALNNGRRNEGALRIRGIVNGSEEKTSQRSRRRCAASQGMHVAVSGCRPSWLGATFWPPHPAAILRGP